MLGREHFCSYSQALCRSASSLGGQPPDKTSASRRSKGVGWARSLAALGLLLSGRMINDVNAQAAASCEDIAVLPHEITLRHASDASSEQIDTHIFQRFFTYQMPNPAEPRSSVIQTRFDPRKGVHGEHESLGGTNDLLLRLKASLKAAEVDYVTQSMKVTLLEEESGRVVVDGASVFDDARSVHLDSLEISSSKSYSIKYEFFEKNDGVLDLQDKTISAAHIGATACNRPFVVQELVIVSQDLMKHRVSTYLDANLHSRDSVIGLNLWEHDIKDLSSKCDFKDLDNQRVDLKSGEQGLYCSR